MKTLITLTASEAHQYERKHLNIRLKLYMMHPDGTDTYEIILKEIKPYGDLNTRKGFVNY